MSTSPPEASENKVEWIDVPIIIGQQSFEEQRQSELSEIFQHGSEQLRRYTKEWQETVKRMRDNFVKLHPVDSDQPTTTSGGDVVAADADKMRTLFFEYPPAAAASMDASWKTRYQVRFDVSDVEPLSLSVSAERSALVVRVSSDKGQQTVARVSILPGVQRHQLRAFLSVDGVLTVEAPMLDDEVDSTEPGDADKPAAAGSKWKRAKASLVVGVGRGKMPSTDAHEEQPHDAEKKDVTGTNEADAARGSTPSPPDDAASPSEGPAAGTTSKEKVGVPIFRDELGTRRMYLAVELGTIYRPRDVIIQVTARRKPQTSWNPIISELRNFYYRGSLLQNDNEQRTQGWQKRDHF